jgi:tetratricopeptide (TPR) repeat protein
MEGESRQRDLKRADELQAQRDFKALIPVLEGLLGPYKNNSELHLRLALIYDRELKRAPSAIHHYERYLELIPQDDRAKRPASDAAASMRKLRAEYAIEAASLEGIIPQREAMELKRQLDRNKQEIEQLKLAVKNAEIATARAERDAELARGEAMANRPKTRTIPPGARTHTVQRGETLAALALKYYKARANWTKIRDANFFDNEGSPPIFPGQVLYIPELPVKPGTKPTGKSSQ